MEVSSNHLNRGERHHADYDDRHRSGKERIPSSRRRCSRQGGAEEAAQAQSNGDLLRESACVPDRYGSVWQRPL
ncbi:hypothetical protein A8D62_05595, partial [Burkholderia cenocepacia]